MKTNRHTRDLAEAKARAERARVYAERLPEFVSPSDENFQTVEWQLEQVKRFNERCCPSKD